MSLKKFIEQENRIAKFWEPSAPVFDIKALTTEDKKNLANRLLTCLSPECLTCDGELRGAKLIAKSRMLNQAKADLEAMGQKVEEDYSTYA
jgi:hypothetical protein